MTVKIIEKVNYSSYKENLAGYVKIVIACALAILLCVAILTYILQLWHADINIPFAYKGDSLSGGAAIKGTIENNWYLYNKYVGAPKGLYSHDFPTPDLLNYLFIKIISLFTSNYAIAMNLFFLSTFPMTTLSTLLVLRQFNLSLAIASIGGLLYSFLPYHFMRGENHLFLSAYYLVPLVVMIILWVFDGSLFVEGNELKEKVHLSVNSKRIVAVVICMLIGSSGIYYAFFACFFLIIAGIMVSFQKKRVRYFVAAVILTAIIGIVIIANIFPSILYKQQNGPNKEGLQRNWEAAEVYGLKLTQLVLPISNHRIPSLARLKNRYNTTAPLVNENDAAALGVIGSLGFIILLVWIFIDKFKPNFQINRLLINLSTLNVAAILLATVGGLGSFFSFSVLPQIRGYNRISVYIAFFSIFAFLLILEYLKNRFFEAKKHIYYALLILILVIGIMDQTSASFIPPYERLNSQYLIDSQFVNKIEKAMPANAMIFQLPYVPYPEYPPVVKMGDYDHLRGYLHSKTLRWSYGAMKGRVVDHWQNEISAKESGDFLETITIAGFSGVYIDRYGFPDMGINLEKKFASILDIKPLISQNNRLLFFDIIKYRHILEKKYDKGKLKQLEKTILWPIRKERLLFY